MLAETEIVEPFLVAVLGLLPLQVAAGQHLAHVDCPRLPRCAGSRGLYFVSLVVQHFSALKQADVVVYLIVEEGIRTHKILCEPGIDGIFGSLRRPPLHFLLMLNLV